MSKENESSWLEYVRNFGELVDGYKNKYGNYSEIMFVLTSELLVTLLFVREYIGVDFVNKKFTETYSELIDINRHLSTPTGNYKPMHRCADGTIGFDKVFYEKNYKDKWDKYKTKIVEVGEDDLLKYSIFKWYLYILTPERKLIIFDKPFSQLDMLISRDEYPKHVTLACSSGLKVLCAGEILIGRNQNNELNFIINNKSGHYRPNKNDLLVMKQYLQKYSNKIYCIDCSEGGILYVRGS